MGAGIAAVAGIENEPSSQRADIEEAQAELRQELSGRNERRRELEFLEKGGDPLEFKFGEALPGLWSLSPTDPLVKHLLPSDGRGSISDNNRRKEDNADFTTQDGSELKRARKFCSLDHSATSISIDKTLPATVVSSSIEHDRKDPPKSNKVAVKGQYARRNRQRSNRYGNGLPASRDSGKLVADGGSSISTVKGHVPCDVEGKDVAKDASVQSLTTDQVSLQSSTADVKACVREGQEKASAAVDLPEAATTVQASSTHDLTEHATELQVCQPLLPETTQEANATALDEGPQSIDQLPFDDGEKGTDAVPCMVGEGKNLSFSLPCDSQAKNSTIMESSPLGTNENKAASHVSTNNILDPEITTDSKTDISEALHVAGSDSKTDISKAIHVAGSDSKTNISEAIHVAGSDKADSAADKIAVDDQTLAKHQSPVDVTRTLPAFESREMLETETSAGVVVSVNPAPQMTSELSITEKNVQANKDSLLEREIDTKGLCGKAQRLEEVKVKVEHETPDAAGSLSVSRANLSPFNASNSQEAGTLQLQHPADGGINSGCDVDKGLQMQTRLSDANDLPADKLPVVAVPQEKNDLGILDDGTKDVKNNPSCDAKKADDNLAAQEAERMKQDSLRDNADWAKQRTFQEAPRKKSHWDFVLEEMAWLANDFMQERLWKIAAAAQIARWVVKEKKQKEFEEMEVRNRQLKVAQSLAKAVKKFWHSVEARLLKESAGSDSTSMDEAKKAEARMTETVEPIKSRAEARPVQAYALRFLKDSSGRQLTPQAEAPPTPDRVSESGIFDFWEEQFSEESLFYTVPKNAMEVYRQSVVSQWEGEYEQRLQEHEAAFAEMEGLMAGEAMEYSSGTYAVGPLVSPLVTGKRSSGFLGGNQFNRGSIPTKRMRTSAARQRAAGGTGPLVSIPVAHLARSDISSCETNSQQDEMTALLEGSSVSGRATDVDSNGAFVRNNLGVDGVDSPFKSKKKKKTRHFNGGHTASAGCDRESEQLWQHNSHRQSEQKEQLKQKGEQGMGSSGLEGATIGAYHGAATVTSSANKLIKQITSRDRGRKYKSGKASLSQPGFGIPWSPVEDQAILGLVYELGLNWELVSDILSSNSQLKGIFRKPKDCKERYRMLTDRLGGDGGDSPDDPSSSAHLPISVTQKGGTRFLPQHLEETLKSHVDCILQLHQQLRSRKLQSESQEPKQLVPEHESHGIKQTALTPLELCELSSTSGELVSHTYPLQPAHGNGLGIPNMLSPGVGMRPTSSAMSALQGPNNQQMSPSMSPSAAINAAATRDAQRMGVSMRPLAAEDQRLRYSRIVAGRGLQTQALTATSGSPLMNLPNTTDCTVPPSLPSGNSAGMMCGLSRGMPVTRTGLPGMGPVGVPNISAGMNNALPSVGMGLSGAGAVVGAVSSPVSMMRRPREVISMGHSPSAALTSVNGSLPSTAVSSPTQNFGAQQQQQQQLLQHNSLPSQQQSPSSSQQQTYNMMRVAKERQQLQQQQLQQQQQKRMLQQQQSPTNNTLQSPFQPSQSLPASQQQHGLSPHAHLFSQPHQPSHLLMQQHTLQEPGTHQQHAVPPLSIPQSAVSPSGQPSHSGNSQNSQHQQSLSQAHQPSSTATSTQPPPFQTKHHTLSAKQHQQQQQGKNMKGIGRGEGQPNMLPSQVSAQISGQQMPQGQRMGDSQGTLPPNLVGGSSVPANLSQVPDAGVQQFQQKGFPQHLPGKHMPACPPVQPTSPPSGPSAPQQQPSPVSLPSTQQQRRIGQQSQSQQRRPQQSQAGLSLGTQLASQPGKSGLQPSSVPPQLPVGFQLGSNTNSPLNMTSPSGGVPLSSPSNTGSGGFPSPQWKPPQNFTPMAAGLYNLSRTNSGIAAQAPHLAMSVGMQLPMSNGKLPGTGNSHVTQDISRGSAQHVTGHVGALSQKASVGSAVNSRAVPVSQHTAPSQRQLAQQQQLSCTLGTTAGQQLRPASSGTAPAPE